MRDSHTCRSSSSSIPVGARQRSDRTQMDSVGIGEARPAAGLRRSSRKAAAAVPAAVMTTAPGAACCDASPAFGVEEACYSIAASPVRFRHNPLVTLSLALLAMAMMQPAFAALSCETNADCAIKGAGKCTQHANGEATCVYKSCAAGFWGAGNTYTDCFECPSDMTSLEGKAFYNTDCFIPCGDSRCFMPEDGYTECSIEAATAVHVCFSTCNRDGFVVANPDRPYATCVPDHQMDLDSTSSDHRITNQSPPKLNPKGEKANPKRAQRGERNRPQLAKRASPGRRLRKSANLGSGPAVALLEHAGEDPFALVSK